MGRLPEGIAGFGTPRDVSTAAGTDAGQPRTSTVGSASGGTARRSEKAEPKVEATPAGETPVGAPSGRKQKLNLGGAGDPLADPLN